MTTTNPGAAPAPSSGAAFDEARSESFAERMIAMLNGGALSFALSLGHRTGLFDHLAQSPPATSEELARGAGLDERYVREWLGAMVTGRIVDFEPTSGRFSLPPEHAAWLTRAAGANCLARQAQYFSIIGGVEDAVLECFRQGGGVPYEAYPRFHEVMAEDSEACVTEALEEHILPLVPGLTGRLRSGIDVLDLGCGAGRTLNRLASLFPASRFRGYDLSREAIASARADAERAELSNVRFEVRDCTDLGEEETHDLVTTFDAIHDQKDPARVLAGIARALRPEGVYLMHDIRASSRLENNLDHPFGPFLYTVSTMHCMTVSLAQGGQGLGTVWGRELASKMLSEAGFQRVELRELEHDPLNDYYVCRLGA